MVFDSSIRLDHAFLKILCGIESAQLEWKATLLLQQNQQSILKLKRPYLLHKRSQIKLLKRETTIANFPSRQGLLPSITLIDIKPPKMKIRFLNYQIKPFCIKVSNDKAEFFSSALL